jgi:DNA polymerase-3 subunit gamma/tau
MLFWQFTIKTMDELNIVSNQNLSIEMFLIRLLYLKHVKQNNIFETNNINISDNKLNDQDKLFTTTDDQNLSIKKNTISQIKNISQEEKTLPKTQLNEIKGKIEIKDFDDLINICNQKKEVKLKFELETNVNLVSFEDQRIEISFNENLDKDFVKYLSTKLFEWTNKRWIITLSKKNGTLTKKQIEKQNKQNLLGEAKKSILYKKMIELFPDAELVDVEIKDKND